MTINELLNKGFNELKEGDFSNPLLDVQLLLCFILNVDKVYIYTHRDELVNKENVDKFNELLNLRKEGYPLQYILKKQEFMGLDFFVDEGVLVPRPDTENLVERVIDLSKDLKGKINIIDIGTGSGAISLSLAKFIKESFVYSIDINKRAIEVARKNALNFDLENVKFLNGDLFNPLDDNLKGNIDIIVSNPPYIPTSDIKTLQREVSKYEPKEALDGGLDGLNFYKEITKEANKWLKKNGVLAYEIGYNQGREVINILKSEGFIKVRCFKDLSKNDRVVIGFKA
ncbi:MAG: peptide chain release factor N(5)-glutamine methyltransferase [Firmicutes bacterium]|nr:peptide chain release factor N(5)-glutamine methyltransferase [Bacillota bacterium]